jgi:signal transduction histidine kinase
MTTSVDSELSARLLLANALRQNKNEIVERWLERINARVAIPANKVFPTDELLNHVPILIEGIADFLERPDVQLDTSVPVTAKAMELGELRHSQGFDVYQILKEHELLSNIILSLLRPIAQNAEIDSGDLLVCWQQIGQAIELIRQATVTHFLRLAAAKVSEREERLRLFSRMVSHELKSRVGAIRGAAKMLEEDWIDDAQRARFQLMILENSDGLQRVLANLESLSRLEVDTRQRRNVLLPQATAEAVRQLRDLAQSRNVEVKVADNLPPVEVDAAAVEVCLVNLISNAIKYSDPARNDSWVEISGTLKYGSQDFGELVVRVRDNGIGIPPHARSRLFQQFYRAHEGTVTETDGTGLGLSIVSETAESLGGSAWAEFPEGGGTVFAFSFPSRRTDDAAAAGVRRFDSVVADAPGGAETT